MDTSDVMEPVSAGTRDRDTLVEELDGHGRMHLAAARVIARDNEEAQDLVQTAFEIALRRFDSLRDPLAREGLRDG